MKKLIITSVLLTVALTTLPALAGPENCEVSCDPQFKQADKELNKVWQSLPPYAQDILRPEQRGWLQQRDETCKDDAKCLTERTTNQTQYLQWISDCLKGEGGKACFEDEFGV